MKPHARSRRTRLRRAAKWAGLALCVFIAAAWVAGWWWNFRYCWSVSTYRVGVVGIDEGLLGVGFGPGTEMPSPGWSAARNSHGFAWAPHWIGPPFGPLLFLPMWMPFVAVALPTGWLWWRDRRAMRPGFCGSCGYDLTGLASGATCPECGKIEQVIV